LHQGYEKKYQQLSDDKGYDKFISAYKKKVSVLKLEVKEHRHIAKLLEQENILLKAEIK